MFKNDNWIDFATAFLPSLGIAAFYGGLYATVAATVIQSIG